MSSLPSPQCPNQWLRLNPSQILPSGRLISGSPEAIKFGLKICTMVIPQNSSNQCSSNDFSVRICNSGYLQERSFGLPLRARKDWLSSRATSPCNLPRGCKLKTTKFAATALTPASTSCASVKLCTGFSCLSVSDLTISLG